MVRGSLSGSCRSALPLATIAGQYATTGKIGQGIDDMILRRVLLPGQVLPVDPALPHLYF